MTPAQLARLERIEKFMDALTLRSFVAKAAAEGQRYVTADVTADDLVVAEAARTHVHIDNLRARVELLEKPLNTATTERTTMAKAATPPYFLPRKESYLDGAEILKLAENSDRVGPEAMGVISSYVQSGNWVAAEDALVSVQRGVVAKATDLSQDVTPPTPSTGPDLAAVVAAIGKLERTVANLGIRLERLEARRPAPAMPPAAGRTVAKASSSGNKKARLSAEQLMAEIDSFIVSPDQAGVVSSMVQNGDLEGAAKVLASARRAHEGEKVRQERKSWQK